MYVSHVGKDQKDNTIDFNHKYLNSEEVVVNLSPSKIYENPEEANKQINALRIKISNLEQEKDFYKAQVEELAHNFKIEKEQRESLKAKYEKKIADLNEQLQSAQGSADVMNRSHNLSMEMDSFNEEQNRALK